MKKILLIAYYYEPMNNGGVQRILGYKKYLPEYGYQVDIITTNSYGVIKDESGVHRFPDIRFDLSHKSFPLVSFLIKMYSQIMVRSELVYDWFHWWRKEVLKHITRIDNVRNYDYIMASYPPVSDLLLGVEICQKYNIPLIVDYRDGLMFEPFSFITNKSNHFQDEIKKLERDVAYISILQVVVNDEMNVYYSNRYDKKTITVQNGFDNEEKFVDIDCNMFPDGFNILYTGNIELSRKTYDIKRICNVLKSIKDVNFIFIGEYKIHEIQMLKQIENVIVKPKISRDKIVPLQKKANMLLLISGENGSGTSGKLYEYLFSKTPILNLGGINSASKIINETNTGKTFNPDDIKGIKKYINDVMKDSFMVGNSKLKRYTRRYQCKILADELTRMEESK